MSIYKVINPVTGEELGSRQTISDADLQDAIARADAAHRAWSKVPVAERAAIVGRIGELHVERKRELAEIMVREVGKPIEQALIEVDLSIDIYKYYADNAESLTADELLEPANKDHRAVVRRNSLGVLLGIMPWNFPNYQVARFAAPNLIVGNTILLKHAPQCPDSADALEQIFHDSGLPADAYINIFASNEQIERVIGDPRVRGVSLTGSERAGAAVAEIAGRHLKKCVLELGGSDPFIVLSTDNMDETVENAAGARLDNAGQACNAAKRFIIADELYDEFLEKLTAALAAVTGGDPTLSETDLGPLSSAAAADRLEDQVNRAVAQGATIQLGGKRDGNYYSTTVLTGMDPSNEAYYEEFFGPVATVYRVSSEEEAIALANDTPFGLGSYLTTTDPEQAERVANQIEAGMVFINVVGAESAELPFGGVKHSGFGRELGRFGADEFVNKKLILRG